MKQDKRLLLYKIQKMCAAFQVYMIPKHHFKAIFYCLFFSLTFLFCVPEIFSQTGKFTVVIDAGHGGHDPGAIGRFAKEKDINLAISLRVANLIEKNFPDVKVVLTRKTDIFLPLQERADIVNANSANLFLCIHTNSSESSAAYGAETFTLGLAKSKSNLDVAMRENSVILLEKDYKTRYKGFDPNSVDSYIMFEFMQDKYIDRSIEIAQDIQKQFVNYCKRFDRGVRQAGFWVLHRSACPSVLIEVGFVSNLTEEKYLVSDYGRQEVATGIYNAFVKFKKEHDKKSGKFTNDQKYEIITKSPVLENESIQDSNSTKLSEDKTVINKIVPETTVIANAFNKTEKIEITKKNIDKNPTVANDIPIFKVQILASGSKLKTSALQFKGQKNVDFFVENKMYKYTIGAETDYDKILEIRKEIIKKFPEAFIIAFVGEKKMSAKEALKLIKNN
jgi:N-acetylmuramoyl-L-alanine amidase